MLFSPRIPLRSLSQLCRRLATATAALPDDRRIWRTEAERGGASQRAAVAAVSDELSRGAPIGEALSAAGDYFPPLFKQVVQVGDATGSLDRTYRRLAEHYEQMLTARRTFLSAISWPVIQLVLALAVVGVTIWLSAALALKDLSGKPLDMFGLGLVGGRGLTIYLLILITIAIGIIIFIESSRRGVLWTRRLQRTVLRIPMLGSALQTLALARFTWALQLVFDTAMDLRKALPLALDATGSELYQREGPRIAANIQSGMSLTQAMAETGVFPVELLDAISVGEQTGMLSETMQRQSAEYRERAAVAVSVLAQLLGYLVWFAVAALIVVLIFRVFSSYAGTIEGLTKQL